MKENKGKWKKLKLKWQELQGKESEGIWGTQIKTKLLESCGEKEKPRTRKKPKFNRKEKDEFIVENEE